MTDKIEMSLEDIIKSQQPQRGGNRGGVSHSGERGSGPRTRRTHNGSSGGGQPHSNRGPSASGGGVLKGRNRGGIQRSKNTRGDVNSAWKHASALKHDLRDRLLAAAELRNRNLGIGGPVGQGNTKLMVSNLDFGVSESNINELFVGCGPLKSASMHYDRSGRSLGTADVVFERRFDAIKAMKQYNGVPLDGRPMSIQLATSDIPSSRVPRLGGGSAPTRSPRRNVSSGPSRGGNRTSHRGGDPRQQQRKKTITAEELDAELDAYFKECV
ncbi:THO complex subunit 4-like [Sabethes cyaneus]|uniref:THO complex subunit 4-like n=1 Tax=Sabethes cyaneus TaxID=53552 RepID=UPI00237E0A2C|nr:THO complex subunit 4-like [Sabethes cyaneus]